MAQTGYSLGPSYTPSLTSVAQSSNFNLIRTPPSGTLRRNLSTGSLGSAPKSVKSYVSNESHYDLVSKFRSQESGQINVWKDSRKKEIANMLKSTYDDQHSFKRTQDGFMRNRDQMGQTGFTELMDMGRANSTETYQRTKYPTNHMDKSERLNEIDQRKTRELNVVLSDQERENKRLHKMKEEKTREYERDVKRMMQNKDSYDKLRTELEKLKLQKKKNTESELTHEKNYITQHVKDLDHELNEKIRKKEDELNRWDKKMQALVDSKPINYDKELARLDWEDRHLTEKQEKDNLLYHHRREHKDMNFNHNKATLLQQIERNRIHNIKDVDAVRREKETLQQDLDEFKRREQNEANARLRKVLDNQKNVKTQIQHQAIDKLLGSNQMMNKEYNLNKKFVSKIRNEIRMI